MAAAKATQDDSQFPHTRGDEPWRRRRTIARFCNFPTRVGMNLAARTQPVQPLNNFPTRVGMNRSMKWTKQLERRISPHAWG